MVLPKPSRTVVYTTRNTVNRLARSELNSNPVFSIEKPCYLYISACVETVHT